MPRFKITCVYIVERETTFDAMICWRDFPADNVSEMTIVELASQDSPEQPKTIAQKVVASTTALVKDAAAQAGMIATTPICPDHQVPMHRKPSKFGQGRFYWGCPVKLDDGKYCRAKPQ